MKNRIKQYKTIIKQLKAMRRKKEQFTVTSEVVEKTKEILKSKLVDGNNFAWLTIINETIEDALDNLSVSKRDKDNLQGIYRESIRNAAYFTDVPENIYYKQEDDIFFIGYKATRNGSEAIEFQALKCKDIDTKVKVIEEEKEVYDLLKQVGVNVVLLRKVGESKQIIMGYEVECDDYVECDEYDKVYHSPKEECIEDAVKVEETPKADAVKEKKTKKKESAILSVKEIKALAAEIYNNFQKDSFHWGKYEVINFGTFYSESNVYNFYWESMMSSDDILYKYQDENFIYYFRQMKGEILVHIFPTTDKDECIYKNYLTKVVDDTDENLYYYTDAYLTRQEKVDIAKEKTKRKFSLTKEEAIEEKKAEEVKIEEKKVEEEVKVEDTPKAEVTETPKVEEKKVKEVKEKDNITEFITNAVFGFISVVCVTVVGALFGIFSFIGKSI